MILYGEEKGQIGTLKEANVQDGYGVIEVKGELFQVPFNLFSRFDPRKEWFVVAVIQFWSDHDFFGYDWFQHLDGFSGFFFAFELPVIHLSCDTDGNWAFELLFRALLWLVHLCDVL